MASATIALEQGEGYRRHVRGRWCTRNHLLLTPNYSISDPYLPSGRENPAHRDRISLLVEWAATNDIELFKALTVEPEDEANDD